MKLPRLPIIVYTIGLIIGIGSVFMVGTVELSSTPGFCGSCHVMKPYYQSWADSSHSQIACVECHISPGLTAEVRKKFEGIAMVARYFTGTYGTNPWAEVDDEACLRCHERRLLAGRELFGDVLFDHRPHLAEVRRGLRLRCTSCHSQIVQGSHITVTSSTCILCHFKDQQPNTGTAECSLCHETPQHVVDAEGLAFDHSDVSTFGMDCSSCHDSARPGAGSVPKERCFTCHNEPDRLAQSEDHEMLHQTHVSDHKVDCTNCHLEIDHTPRHHLQAAQTECSICHDTGHSPSRDLYAGLGGKGVPPMPDIMFRAGVRCEGCHLEPGGEHGIRTAGAMSCMNCHGPDYNGIYESWSATLDQRTSGLRRQLDRTAGLKGATSVSEYTDAKTNLEMVEKGEGIHNFPYSLSLLEAAHEQLNATREGLGAKPLPLPWPEAPYESDCFNCHQGIEARSVRAFGGAFPHEPHVVNQELDCSQCHSTHEQREQDGLHPLLLQKTDCAACHHGESTADNCTDCHGRLMGPTLSIAEGNFSHEMHVEGMELDCATCHGDPPGGSLPADRDACTLCHEE
jgi:nitrate/TMAO reductase-like tetraheme cytochrome c subunit